MRIDSPPFTREVVHPEEGVLGWLCVDSWVDGLAFGGCRMTPDVTRDEVEELARCMTLKLAAHGSPTGGAKAGIRMDPKASDAAEKLAYFAQSLSDLLKGGVVLGKDMGATDKAIDGMYAAIDSPQLAPLVTSPCTRLRDFKGYRRHMTGLGVAFATRAAMGGQLKGVRVAIQGAGLVGLGSALRLQSLGAEIVAMSDVERALYWREGVDVTQLEEAIAASRSLKELSQGEPMARDDLFALEVDVVVLAASSYSVSRDHVSLMKAPRIVEGCNMGFSKGARELAQERGIEVVPDVLASSSSAAMVCRQIAAGGRLDETALWRAIEEAIEARVGAAQRHARQQGITLREAHIRWAQSER